MGARNGLHFSFVFIREHKLLNLRACISLTPLFYRLNDNKRKEIWNLTTDKWIIGDSTTKSAEKLWRKNSRERIVPHTGSSYFGGYLSIWRKNLARAFHWPIWSSSVSSIQYYVNDKISQTVSDQFANLPAVSTGRKFYLSWSHCAVRFGVRHKVFCFYSCKLFVLPLKNEVKML